MDYFTKLTQHLDKEERGLGNSGAQYSLSDPRLAAFFGLQNSSVTNINVSEFTSLGVTALYRAINLIAGTMATLDLKTYVKNDNGTMEQVPSVLDDPGEVIELSPFEWKELVYVHLLLHGNAYLLKITDNLGRLIGLQPIHPLFVLVKWEMGVKTFEVS